MFRHLPVRRSIAGIPFVLGLPLMALVLGASISLLSDVVAPEVVVAAAVAIALIALAAWAAPTAGAKSVGLIRSLRWWHWLWFLSSVSALVFRIRDAESIQKDPVDFWAAWRIAAVAVIAVLLFGRLAGRRTSWGAALVHGLPAGLLVYALISLVSTLWSVYPPWTLYKSLEYLIDLALLAAILTAVRVVEEVKALFDWTWLLSGALLLTVWLGVVFRPQDAVGTDVGPIGIRIEGVMPYVSANGVGDIAAVLLLVSATRLLSRTNHQPFYWFVCLAALVSLVLAQSRSPAIGALLGVLAILVIARRFGLIAGVALAGAALVALTSADAVVKEAFLRGQDSEMIHSLTGRATWWAFAGEVVRDNPLFGLGGYAAGRFAVLGQLGATETSTLHSTWFELLVGVGIVGMIPFVVTMAGTWFNLVRPFRTKSVPPLVRQLQVEAIGIFVLLCVRSIFSDEFIWHPALPFFLVVIYAELRRRGQFDGAPVEHSAPALAERVRRFNAVGAVSGMRRQVGTLVRRP